MLLQAKDEIGISMACKKKEKGRDVMSPNVKEYVAEKVKELMEAPSCCAEAKAACRNWLESVGTGQEAEASKNLVAELEGDIMPIDGLIAFAGSEMGAEVFGAERAKGVLAHAEEIKAAGAKYCDCPACTAAAAILDRKEEILP